MCAMSQRDRAAFIHQAGAEGMPIDVARKLLRYGATLHRLAEAQCNGDWPADNGTDVYGQREECARCHTLWRGRMVTLRTSVSAERVCADCRTSNAAKTLVGTLPGWSAETQGDPRGAVLTVVAPSGRRMVAG